jgi:hypothetical protein
VIDANFDSFFSSAFANDQLSLAPYIGVKDGTRKWIESGQTTDIAKFFSEEVSLNLLSPSNYSLGLNAD